MANVLPARIVMALITNDGVRGRGHCRNIFNPNYNAAGAAYGLHARFGSVCSIDFPSGYAQGTFVRYRDRCHEFVLTTRP